MEDHPPLPTLGISPHTHTQHYWVSPAARRALLELFCLSVSWLVGDRFSVATAAVESTHWLARRNPAEPDRPLSQGL